MASPEDDANQPPKTRISFEANRQKSEKGSLRNLAKKTKVLVLDLLRTPNETKAATLSAWRLHRCGRDRRSRSTVSDRGCKNRLIVGDGLRCSLVHFERGPHFLDLRCLLLRLGGESLYLFVLLRDRSLQLLNFEIEHGLVAVFEITLGNGVGLAWGSGLELGLRNGYGQPVSIGIGKHRS